MNKKLLKKAKTNKYVVK